MPDNIDDDRHLFLSRDEMTALTALLPNHAGERVAAGLGVPYVPTQELGADGLVGLAKRKLIHVDDGGVRTAGPTTALLAQMAAAERRIEWIAEGGDLGAFTKVFFGPKLAVIATIDETGGWRLSATPPERPVSAFVQEWLTTYERHVGDNGLVHVAINRVGPEGSALLNCVRVNGVWEAARSTNGGELTLDEAITARDAIIRAADTL